MAASYMHFQCLKKLASHCTCSDEAWPNVEAIWPPWYLMNTSIKETTFIWDIGGGVPDYIATKNPNLKH